VIRLGVPADLPAVRDVFRRASLSNAGDRAVLLAHPEHLIHGPAGLRTGVLRWLTRTARSWASRPGRMRTV
jgi:hypothetical protein